MVDITNRELEIGSMRMKIRATTEATIIRQKRVITRLATNRKRTNIKRKEVFYGS